MKKIRVLRLLEYTYDSVETMQADMARWAVQGVFTFGAVRGRGPEGRGTAVDVTTIKSVVLPLEVLDVVPDDKVVTGLHGSLTAAVVTSSPQPHTKRDAIACSCGRRFETPAELASHLRVEAARNMPPGEPGQS